MCDISLSSRFLVFKAFYERLDALLFRRTTVIPRSNVFLGFCLFSFPLSPYKVYGLASSRLKFSAESAKIVSVGGCRIDDVCGDKVWMWDPS